MGGPLLAEQLGWSALHAVLAMAIAPLAIGALALPRLQSPRERSRESPWRALEFFGRPAALGALCFLVFYRLGDLAMAPMIRVFWRDSGASLTLIGLVPNGISALVGIAGSLLGGVLVARVSLGRALGIGGVLASASNAAYAAAAWAGAPLPAVVAASLAESACSGVAGVALVSLLVAACERAHAGVQFAVLTALSPAAGRLLGGPSGEFVAAYGYGAWFALTGALTLPALAFVPAVVRWADARPDRQSTVA
jgi:PAT family beta-lactamase induction signal transducer AmpG